MNNPASITGLILAIATLVFCSWTIGPIALSAAKDRRRRHRFDAQDLVDVRSSSDGGWRLEAGELCVTIRTAGPPPTSAQIQQAEMIAHGRSLFHEKAVIWLSSQFRDCRHVARLEAQGVEVDSNAGFILELVDPTDEEELFRVHFKNGEPVGWTWD